MEQVKYLWFAQEIKSKIAQGEYPVGSRLPGEHRLVKMYGLSRQTIRKAIEILCEEQVLKRAHGSGTYVLKSQRREKSGLVGLIATHISLSNFSSIISAIEQGLTEKGYSTIIKTTDNRLDLERKALTDLIEKNVDGIIVEPVKPTLPNPNKDLYDIIEEKGIGLVFINCWYQEFNNPVYVAMNNTQGGRECARYLTEKGHRRIAAVFKANDQESVARYASLAEYLHKAGMQMADNNILWFTMPDDTAFDAQILKAAEGCTAVACFNDEIAFKVIAVLQKNGRQVPEDIAVIAFDNSVFSEMSSVKITALEHAQGKIGLLAAEKIANLIAGKAQMPVLLPWKLVEKKSTETTLKGL